MIKIFDIGNNIIITKVSIPTVSNMDNVLPENTLFMFIHVYEL